MRKDGGGTYKVLWLVIGSKLQLLRTRPVDGEIIRRFEAAPHAVPPPPATPPPAPPPAR
jgi:hypothetical protein